MNILFQRLIALSFCCVLAQLSLAAGSSSMPSAAPQIDPVREYKKGVQHLEAKRYKKAEKAFRNVLKVSKNDANTHYVLGLAYLGQEKLPKAKKSLLKAIKYNDAMASARGRLAYVYSKLGDADGLAEQQQALLKQQTACGSCEQAATIAEALRIASASDGAGLLWQLDAYTNIGAADIAYIEAVGLINRGNYTGALSILAHAAKAFGPHPDILTYQGFAHRKLGHKVQAYAFYQAALTVAPDHRGANEYLGEYFIEMANMPAAKNQLAILQSICHFGCEEAEELKRWIVAAES